MILTRSIGVVFFLLASLQIFAQPDSIRIAFYNCENYFDSFRDTTINDEEYTPQGSRRWNYSKFISKRNNLFKVIAAMGDPSPPELLAVCEVENRFVLNQLAYNTPLSKHEYAVLHQDSRDRRGIDVGLLYQKSRVRVLDSRFFDPSAVDSSLRTRSILYAKFGWGRLDTLHLLVAHLPSKLGGKQSEISRDKIAHFLRSKVDSINQAHYKPHIVVTGDFNDTPDSDALKVLNDEKLVSLAKPLHDKGLGSIRYRGEWELIDQFYVSAHLLDASTPISVSGGMQIFNAPFLLEDDTQYGGLKPMRTFIGFRYNGGYSDHLPVVIRINRAL